MQQAQAEVAAPTGGRQQRQLSDTAIQWLFISPTLILLIALNIGPLFYSLYLSFTDFSAIAKEAPTWVGFENYVAILTDPQMWTYFSTTGRFAFLSVGLQTVIGFGLALLLNEQFKGSGLLTTLILVPMMLSPVVVGLFWKLIFNPSYGIFNYLIGFRNPATAPDWLASSKTRVVGRGHRGRVDVVAFRDAAVSIRAQGHSRLSLRGGRDRPRQFVDAVLAHHLSTGDAVAAHRCAIPHHRGVQGFRSW